MTGNDQQGAGRFRPALASVPSHPLTTVLLSGEPQRSLGLDQLERGSPSRLGDLYRMGLPVPPGFDVMPSAYREFMEKRRLYEVAEGVLAAVDARGPWSLERAAAQVRCIMTNATMPDQVAVRVRAAYESLGQGPVRIRIVRPGGLGAWRSHDERPVSCNVQGISRVLHAIKDCWAVCFSPADMTYRVLDRSVDQPSAPILSVQKTLSAEVSGLVHTRDPMQGYANNLCIEAIYGLSDTLLEGHVTPDVYRVDRATQRVVAYTGASQSMSLQVCRSRRIGTWDLRYSPVRSEQRKRKLSDSQVQRLARMALRVEGQMNGPHVMEWSIAGGQIYVHQVWPTNRRAVAGLEAA